MKLASVFLLLFIPTHAQQPPTGNARTTGTCSVANAGTVGTVTLNCTGLTAEQQSLLRNVPDLLNKLLAQQESNTFEILSRLDTCIAQGAPRSLTAEQRTAITTSLANMRGMPEIQVRAPNSNNESSRYAQQLRDAFADTPGWTAPPVFANIIAGTTLPTGLEAIVQSAANIYGIAIQRLFERINIPIQFALDPSLAANVVILIVYQKPLQ
jgi:hypothetical protein